MALIVLAIAANDYENGPGRQVAKLFSGRIYQGFIVVSILLLLFLAWQRRSRFMVRYAVEVSLLTLIITNVMKYVVPLGRPPRMHDGVILEHSKYSPGFPSAHTAFAFGLAWLVWRLQPRLAPVWFAIAIAVGWSRVEIRSHYPYQVICGGILGCLLGYWICQSPHGVLHSIRARFKRPATAPTVP
jgi:membrane-associated phospholipid phosphatase